MKFYSLKNIMAKNAPYNIIISERSIGKTYACFMEILKNYVKYGKQGAYIRRWADDLKTKQASNLFQGIVENGEIEKLTNGEFTDIYYRHYKWYLCTYDSEGNRVCDNDPFMYFFALTSMEHDKSVSYPLITTIVFDEFITRSMYLPDEFVIFCNVLSTIIRHRSDVKIFMLGNTVNKYCPYFAEMGLKHVKDMQQGTIDLYRYGDSKLTVAVEFVKPNKAGKESDFYFSFDNPKLQMITGGAWEIDIYPHCPCKYTKKDILFTYYIDFDGDLLQCEIVQKDDLLFTFIHAKTTPVYKGELIYSCEYHAEPNYRRKITNPISPNEKKIFDFYKREKVFYANNEIGEIVRNYLLWCIK